VNIGIREVHSQSKKERGDQRKTGAKVPIPEKELKKVKRKLGSFIDLHSQVHGSISRSTSISRSSLVHSSPSPSLLSIPSTDIPDVLDIPPSSPSSSSHFSFPDNEDVTVPLKKRRLSQDSYIATLGREDLLDSPTTSHHRTTRSSSRK
jgi:hypothetical protein